MIQMEPEDVMRAILEYKWLADARKGAPSAANKRDAAEAAARKRNESTATRE
jgi:hypothetical protein